jgi:hypothetical protein
MLIIFMWLGHLIIKTHVRFFFEYCYSEDFGIKATQRRSKFGSSERSLENGNSRAHNKSSVVHSIRRQLNDDIPSWPHGIIMEESRNLTPKAKSESKPTSGISDEDQHNEAEWRKKTSASIPFQLLNIKLY